MIFLWFIIAIYAMFIVIKDPTLLEYLLSFVGGPVTGTIILYMAKAAFENNQKIKCSHQIDNDTTPPNPPEGN